MLMQMINYLTEQDPSLSTQRTINVRRYVVNRWNCTHEESIDKDGVTLFLCDKNRKTLTNEQGIFARECHEKIKACYRNAAFQILQCGKVMRRHLVSSPEEYYRIFLSQYATLCSKRFSLGNGL